MDRSVDSVPRVPAFCPWVVSVGLLLLATDLSQAQRAPSAAKCAKTYSSDVRCGLPVLQPSALPKHPSEAIRGEFPWHVAIYHKESVGPLYSCGGSLINDRFVLTVAHCTVNENNDYPLSAEVFELLLGYHDLYEPQDLSCSEKVGVRRNHVHPDYRTHSYRHDIALLELERQVRFTDPVLPVCLDTAVEDPPNFYQTIGKVPGWGYTEVDEMSSWLRMTEIPIVNYVHCLNSNPDLFGKNMYDGMFCGGYANGSNVCNGDSGGGLVTYRQGRWELQGIVSYTALRDVNENICDTRQYAAYVKVRHYRDWIGSICHMPSPDPAKSEKLTMPPAKTADLVGRPERNCGKRKVTAQSLIVNGVRSVSGEWPWHAAVFALSKRSREYVCGGTLISEGYIMTAASCVRDWHPRKRPFVVQLGQNQLFDGATTSRDVRVLAIETSDDSQMALLRLETDVRFNDFIQPICLPVDHETSGEERGDRSGFIAGFGQTDPEGDVSPALQSTSMPIVDNNLCILYRIFERRQADGMLCAGHGNGTNACLGDQGGGFYERDETGTWTVTGVISRINIYRKRCDPHGYVGIADVMHYLSWIMEQMGDRQQPGRREEGTSSHSKESRDKHHHRHHHRHRHRHRNGSGESGSNEGSNESNERSIVSSVKNVMQAKIDLVKDVHGTASSTIKKIFG
ncbi:transmembrane protease serine 9-like [Anopheles albimanus]|uniref:transmembrane protease serine 9-like n=1 Tax=Anopheles albimanus TaxID=7167 RepID=UPI00163ED0DE|nr:transmembrane protease serine 9-like [Anopheles albimanus]